MDSQNNLELSLTSSEIRSLSSSIQKGIALYKDPNNTKSQRQIAKLLGLKRTTFQKALLRDQQQKPIGQNGRPCKLTENEELILKHWIEHCFKEGNSPTFAEIAREVFFFRESLILFLLMI